MPSFVAGPGRLVGSGAFDLANQGFSPGLAWGILACFAVLALCVGLQRLQFARIMAGELSPEGFKDFAADPAQNNDNGRLQRLAAMIRAEQHARLAVYRADAPFRGAGDAFDPWSVSIQLRPRKSLGDQAPGPGRATPRSCASSSPSSPELRIPAPTAAAEGARRTRPVAAARR